jgi:hypothetical protein
MLLRDIHSKLLTQYDCKEVCAPSQSQVNVGASARLSSQDGVSQQQETAPLSLPQLNHLFEDSFVRDESSASNADDVAVIPSQHRVTQQILSHWQPFRDLKLMFAGSRRAEQLSLRSQQRIVATVEDSGTLHLKGSHMMPVIVCQTPCIHTNFSDGGGRGKHKKMSFKIN